MGKRTARTPAARQRRLEERLRVSVVTLLGEVLRIPRLTRQSLSQPLPLKREQVVHLLHLLAAGRPIAEGALTEAHINEHDAADDGVTAGGVDGL